MYSLLATWQHNSFRVVNQTLNNTHFLLTEFIYSENNTFSKLTITNVGEGAQGVYRVVAINDGGRAESEEAQLMLSEFLWLTHVHVQLPIL